MNHRILELLKPAVKYVVLVLAVVLIALGLWQGEAGEVLQKAVHICLECIGVG
ncbi:MAG: CD1871A family CXXC motif-containing protein [Oscillospiraceae bacterium]|nr:CD1871A family CXXC motif-containing protein [Oscillospiraceae bacterium]